MFEFSFEEAAELYGCQVFVYYDIFLLIDNDKLESIGDHFYSKNVRFFRMGLHHEDMEKDDSESNLTTLASVYDKMKPLHGEVIIDYLKMDIEGREWKVN